LKVPLAGVEPNPDADPLRRFHEVAGGVALVKALGGGWRS
jgi:hypothetical protein